MLLRAGHFEFQFPRPMMLMGIVNVMFDFFCDGPVRIEEAFTIGKGVGRDVHDFYQHRGTWKLEFKMVGAEQHDVALQTFAASHDVSMAVR